MTVLEFLEATKPGADIEEKWKRIYVRPRAQFADGFNVSIQCSKIHYCAYHDGHHGDIHELISVELGFPSEIEEMILEYAEDKDDPCESVYGYVPIEIMEEVCKKHGGIIENQFKHLKLIFEDGFSVVVKPNSIEYGNDHLGEPTYRIISFDIISEEAIDGLEIYINYINKAPDRADYVDVPLEYLMDTLTAIHGDIISREFGAEEGLEF